MKISKWLGRTTLANHNGTDIKSDALTSMQVYPGHLSCLALLCNHYLQCGPPPPADSVHIAGLID